ncbi:MAG: CapA family protein [Clostridia bacterium]|nr:CapA family protein [Clostridia bacterium]
MRRILTALLALTLALCSCSGTEGEGDSRPESSNTVEVTEPAEPITNVGGVAPEAVFAPQKEQTRVSVSLLGDCIVGSDLGTHAQDSYNRYADDNPPEYFLGQVQWVLAKDDITVANCETVLTDNTGLTPINGSGRFGPASNARAFAKGSVEIVSVANDRTGDYGTRGYMGTVNALAGAGVTVGEDMKPVYYEVKGVTVGVLACNCRSSDDASRILQTITEMNERSDVQLILPHGGTENTYIPDGWRRSAFRQFIDAGAEVVAASHPDALQPFESYNGGIIAYSLGDFISDGTPENAGIILSVTLVFEEGGYKGLEYQVYPCYLYTGESNSYCPELAKLSDPAYNRIVEFIYGLREAPVEEPRYLPE